MIFLLRQKEPKSAVPTIFKLYRFKKLIFLLAPKKNQKALRTEDIFKEIVNRLKYLVKMYQNYVSETAVVLENTTVNHLQNWQVASGWVRLGNVLGLWSQYH